MYLYISYHPQNEKLFSLNCINQLVFMSKEPVLYELKTEFWDIISNKLRFK